MRGWVWPLPRQVTRALALDWMGEGLSLPEMTFKSVTVWSMGPSQHATKSWKRELPKSSCAIARGLWVAETNFEHEAKTEV